MFGFGREIQRKTKKLESNKKRTELQKKTLIRNVIRFVFKIIHSI